MDGYLQSALVVNSLQQSNNRTNATQAATRVPPFPPSNKEFNCNELNTPDGIYLLLHETFYDTIAPHFTTGTRASVVTHIIHANTLVEDEDTNSDTPMKSAALPIPNTLSRRSRRHGSTSSIGLTNGNSYFPPPPPLSVEMNEPSSLNNSLNNSFSSLFSKSIHPASTSTTISRSASQASTSILSRSSMSTKPKNHLSKTNSTFVTKFSVQDNLQQKLMAFHSLEDSFTFFNIGFSFIWVDSNSKAREPLSRIVFSKSHPTCHDINETTQCEDHIDIIIGFSTGDIVWYEPLSSKYVRLNKGGGMVASAVTMIKWLPNSEDLFIAIFKNGTAMIMDKERDDQTFNIPDHSLWTVPGFYASRPHRNSKHNPVSFWKMSDKELTDVSFSSDNQHIAVTGADGALRIINYRSDSLTDIFASYFGKVTCVDWSPDGLYIITGGEDDLVSLWSFVEKRLIARCHGHKSWVTGVAFDPLHCHDGRNYRFGSVGEDCNLILWDFSFTALIKPKHPPRLAATSPPRPLPLNTVTPTPPVNVERKKSFRGRSLFRGFSTPDASMTAVAAAAAAATASSSSTSSGSFSRFRKRSSRSIFSSSLEMSDTTIIEDPTIQKAAPIFHPPLKKYQTAKLLPTTVKAVHADPCVSLLFREKTIVTTDRRGRIRTWGRPPKKNLNCN